MTYSKSKCKSAASYIASKNFQFQDDLDTHERFILMLMATWADNPSGTAYPFRESIAEKTGKSVRQVQRALNRLMELGYLIQVARRNKLVAVYAVSLSQKYLGRENARIEPRSRSKNRLNGDTHVTVVKTTTVTPKVNNSDTHVTEKIKEDEEPFSKASSIRVSPCEQSSPAQPPKSPPNLPQISAKMAEGFDINQGASVCREREERDPSGFSSPGGDSNPRGNPELEVWWKRYEEIFGLPEQWARDLVSRYKSAIGVIQRAIDENTRVEVLLDGG